ncbi:hypothetical protein BDQ94DRAFT_164438 [Aspergillus welwitschiae]|uniref:Uncharacterized protein n=1 Tax=Aspergillus welwitschiae TaxID=1341132 RepID=A0A3F3PHS3_9EURO|nr:hypothetical protein BDQ94DRAFT_164438 [Aspergillus welwitschiae]RDH26501.1 hypothetical protein BDQ94DRAFT_164438 [Aspergillus welwitschiae]
MAKFSAKVVKEFAQGIPWSKVIKKAANVDRGQRVFPSRTPKNDAKSNLRFDKGSVVDGKHELILQANKNAENAGVKAATAEDSYKIWAKILIDPENLDENQAAEDLSYILQGNGLKQLNSELLRITVV